MSFQIMHNCYIFSQNLLYEGGRFTAPTFLPNSVPIGITVSEESACNRQADN